jgi:hypothetical protein
MISVQVDLLTLKSSYWVNGAGNGQRRRVLAGSLHPGASNPTGTGLNFTILRSPQRGTSEAAWMLAEAGPTDHLSG